MKTFYLSLFAAAFAFTASAGVTETFTSGQGDWTIGSSASGSVENGHLNVTMAKQTNGLYRADLSFKKDFTLNSTDKVLAIKFIGTRPDGHLSFEILGAEKFSKNNTPNGTVLTSAGNNIYYFTIDPQTDLAETAVTFKIADCNVKPYSYSVDWIKFYPSVEALTADKDWKDDGDNDQDEVSVLPSPVQIEGKDGYPTLADAWNAAVDGDVIVLNEDQTINDRVNGKSECSITIKAGKANTISRASGYKGILILANNGGTTILEDLTIDGADIAVTGSTLEQNKGNLNLKNVTLKNVNGSGDKGYIVIMGGGNAAIENLTVENCTPAAATKADVFVGLKSVTFSGNNKCSVYIEKDHFIKAGEGLANTEPVELRCDAARATDTRIVENCADATQFKMGTPGFTLVAKEGHLHVSKTETSLIDVIGSDDDNAPVEYFNLQGVRVENPENGLYIRRQGKKVEKIFVR
jgi:hypothetical protein